jgi:predicted O-methyltransferase YrrM
LPKIDPKRALEIGSHEGRSACWTLKNCPRLMSLYCIDVWRDPEIERRFDDNIAEAMEGSTVLFQKFKSPSVPKLAELLVHQSNGFDFIYVDGSHTAPDVLADAVLSFELLKPGGLLAFDDYLWVEDNGVNPLNAPKIAIDAFVNIYRQQLRVVSGMPLYQLYVQKAR